MEVFRVRDVEVRGARFLSEQDIEGLLALTPESSIWGEIQRWTDQVVSHPLDLPILFSQEKTPEGARLVPEEVRRLAAEVDHLMAADSAFLRLVSSVEWTEKGSLLVRWTDPRVDFLLPSQASPMRLRAGLSALADAVLKYPGRVPSEIDLRFSDQVVVRHQVD